MSVSFAPAMSESLPLFLVTSDALEDWLSDQCTSWRSWIEATGFSASAGRLCLLPGDQGACAGAVFGLGSADLAERQRFRLAIAAKALPPGAWKIATELSPAEAEEAALGWLLGQYSFTRYAGRPAQLAQLVCPGNVDGAKLEAIAAGEFLTRDLINTPASDMGPQELEDAARAVATVAGADIQVISGPDLQAQNFPLIHAVGRASDRAPRLLDMRWGSSGPRLTLVGKGVCFDTGGLNLKPGASMGLMKKDMGGAATVLGLAQTIMALDLPLQLRVLIPAVENSVSSNSFRPQDILPSRAGLTVEINNTDAEGRLVLADALSLACEEESDLLISMATLTGAARVAVGPDLAPYYCDDDALSAALSVAAKNVRDPVWRMPFHAPYEAMIEPGIADLDNAPAGGFAGSITAALFLRRFTADHPAYMHFDIYGWQPAAAPGRPKGGVGQGARAVLEALPALLDLTP